MRRSEIRYRRLFEAARDGVLIMDLLTRKVIDANPFMTELLGYTRAELLGKELFEIGLLKDEAASRAAFRELQRQGFIRYDDLPLETKTGESREVEFVSNLYREDEDQVVQCNVRDITERKRAEEVLRESEERYRTLFDLGSVAVYSCDTSGVIQDFNRRAAELWGREPALGDTDERFCGSFKLFRPDGSLMPHEQCPMAEVLSGKISEARDAEVSIERPDGSQIIVIVNIRPLKNKQGEVTGAINCFYDITERKRGEEALRESEERYRTLFAAAPMAVFVCDRNAVIQQYNPRAMELWGREPKRGVEQHCGSVKLWLPDDTLLPHAQSPIMEVLRTGIPMRNVEVFIERPDGSRIPVLVNFAALKNAEGEITGAITTFIDITERKQAEEERVSLLGREQQARKEAEDANRLKDEFLATLSHELRNPLNSITGYSKVLIHSPEAEHSPLIRQAAEVIHRNAGAQAQLINDLLDLSRLGTGKLTLEARPLSLATVIGDAVESIREQAAGKEIELRVDLTDEPLVVNADPFARPADRLEPPDERHQVHAERRARLGELGRGREGGCAHSGRHRPGHRPGVSATRLWNVSSSGCRDYADARRDGHWSCARAPISRASRWTGRSPLGWRGARGALHRPASSSC
jgi:PAS domain S-box-containing protein